MAPETIGRTIAMVCFFAVLALVFAVAGWVLGL